MGHDAFGVFGTTILERDRRFAHKTPKDGVPIYPNASCTGCTGAHQLGQEGRLPRPYGDYLGGGCRSERERRRAVERARDRCAIRVNIVLLDVVEPTRVLVATIDANHGRWIR